VRALKIFWVVSESRKTGEKQKTAFALRTNESGDSILAIMRSRRLKILSYGYTWQTTSLDYPDNPTDGAFLKR